MMYSDVWNLQYFGNAVGAYFIAAVSFIGAVFLLVAVQKVIVSRIKAWAAKTPGKLDDLVVTVIDRAVLPVFYVAAFYFAASQLSLTPGVDRAVRALFVIVATFQVIRIAISAAVFFIEQGFDKDPSRVQVTKKLFSVVKVLVWGVGAVFVLDNLGFDVNAVIAGLGIGGVAVALAAQTILGDLFNYFVIFFDKPFEEGDTVVVGDVQGVVQHVGIKTTRLISLSGEQIICSNTDLTSSRIRNYKRMERRRVVFKVGVVYGTKLELLKRIPETIRRIIEKNPDAVFDRSHFQAFGYSSLDIETVYYVLGSDYNKYMEIQQAINLTVLEAFEREGIEFAFPTRTLHLQSPAWPAAAAKL